IHFLKVVFMAQGKRERLSTEQRADMWRRWKSGESLHEIGRAFGKGHGSIRFLLTQCGGIAPAARRRSPRTLTLAEREDISRGIASGLSIREIATELQRLKKELVQHLRSKRSIRRSRHSQAGGKSRGGDAGPLDKCWR